jgi:hypothetical protein
MPCIEAGGLFLHSAGWMADDDGRDNCGVAFRDVEDSGQLQAGAVEGDRVLFHAVGP